MKTINELEKYFYHDPKTQVDNIGTQGIRKIVFTKDDMGRHGGRIPYEILEYSRMFLYTYLEESRAGFGFIFSNDPIEHITQPIGMSCVFEERGFWSVLTFGLANRTMKQTLADVKKFIRSDKNQVPEPVVQAQLETPTFPMGEKFYSDHIPQDWKQLDKHTVPQYTFEQVKQLVTIIRGDMDDQLIKQLLEMNHVQS